MNLDTTLRYLHDHGNFVQRAQLEARLGGAPASAQVIEAALGDQRADGGFAAFASARHSSLEATCRRLAQAEALGLSARQPRVALALGFLQRRQGLEGDFEEEGWWAGAGGLAARLHLTAHCGFWLAFYGLEEARAALYFLRDRLDASHRLPGSLPGYWLACGLALKLGEAGLAEVLAEHLRSRLQGLPAHDLAPMLRTLKLGGIFSGHPLWLEGCARLAALQRSDGAWEGSQGPDVSVTLEALRVLVRAGRYAL
jgi:hypothetical protein